MYCALLPWYKMLSFGTRPSADSHKHQTNIKSPDPIAFIWTGARQNPAACCTNQGNGTSRFAPPPGAGGKNLLAPREDLGRHDTCSTRVERLF